MLSRGHGVGCRAYCTDERGHWPDVAVHPGISLAVLGALLVNERRLWHVLAGAVCLVAGAYLAIERLLTMDALLH